MTRLVQALVWACLPPALALAQTATPAAQPPVEGPTFRTGVELITVDVTVLDSRSRPITDLHAPEFVVTIDGEPRRVVSAEFVHVDVDAAKKVAATQEDSHFSTNSGPPSGRLILFVVDQGNISLGGARAVLDSASRFLNALSPFDRVAFIAIPPPGPAVDFTTDHAPIREAMSLVHGASSRFDDKFNIGVVEAMSIAQNHDQMKLKEVVDRECGSIGLRADVLERCERDIEMQATQMMAMMREQSSRSLSALRGLLRDLEPVEGQKSMIFISQGLQLETGATELNDLVSLAGLARVTLNILLLESNGMDASRALISPTMQADRNFEVQGLEMLAGQSRGAFFRVAGNGEGIFDRLTSELSGYYLLGVEQVQGDRDGKRHRIGVEVRRKGVTLRSRRAFILPEGATTAAKAEERLGTALRSPFPIPEVPLRVTSYAYRDGAPGKVRVVIAAELQQTDSPSTDYTVGFVLADAENRVVANMVETRALAPADDRPGAPLVFVGSAVVDPGMYTLRFGAVDAEGRRGTVLRPVPAWETTGQEFAVGDLIVAGASERKEGLMPAVEARVGEGRLATYLELYASAPAAFDATAVAVEIAPDDASEPLVRVPARLVEASRPELRIAQAMISTRLLPPGRYLTRVHITRDGKPAGFLTRPFIVLPRVPSATDSPAEPLPAALLGAAPKFELSAVLTPQVIGTMLDLAEQKAPELKSVFAAARAGKYMAAGMEALQAGHQDAASFLGGLDSLQKGQLERALQLLSAGAGQRREYFPAAFYLGAGFAALGRDRDAAGVWQLSLGTVPRPSIVYPLAADARLRDNRPEAIVPLLEPARQQYPEDLEIARRLGLAYVMTGRYGEAVPLLDAWLAKNGTDQDVLFAAVLAMYESSDGRPLPDAARARTTRYAQAYRGPLKGLVTRYVEALQAPAADRPNP